MSCTIQSNEKMKKWTINPKSLDKLYPLLYKQIEIGGKFTFPINKQGLVKKITSVKKIHTMNGASDSVQAPEGIANFHTHPISCYTGEGTVWGWPSGEDIRETFLFGMKGSVVHLVLAIEGVYSLQINPCILSSFMHIEHQTESVLDKMVKTRKGRNVVSYLVSEFAKHFRRKDTDSETQTFLKSKGITTDKKLKLYIDAVKSELKIWLKTKEAGEFLVDILSDTIRGLVVLYIEIYYRSSHRFRSHDVNHNENEKLYPIDFIKFVNSFRISNIFNTGKKIKGCGDLQCGGVPVYEGKKGKSSSFSKYVSNYERDTGFYMVNKYGETLSLNASLKKFKTFESYIKDIVIGNDCTNKNLNKWKKNWFHMSFAPNKVLVNGKYQLYISKNLNANDRLSFLNEHKMFDPKTNDESPIILDKTPTFYFYSIKGNCDHVDITKHLIAHKPKTISRNLRRRRSRKKYNTKVIVYGSDKCGWCKRAVKYLEKKGVRVTKRYSDSINQAVDNASKFAGKELNSVPAIFVGKEYMGGYNSVKKVIKNVTTS